MLISISACQTGAPDPRQVMSDLAGDSQQTTCLDNVRQDQLDLALQRCDELIASQPKRAEAYSERSLVQMLIGNRSEACRDIATALALIDDAATADPLLVNELNVRQAACNTDRISAGKG